MDCVALVNLWVGEGLGEEINKQSIPFLNYNLLENFSAELIVFKVGFLSIVAVEWFVFLYSSIKSELLLFSNDIG